MSLTAANAVIAITVAGLYTTPIQLKGFSADDVLDTEELVVAETSMGVDGVLSAGFVYNSVDQSVIFQSDSPSNRVFEVWNNTNQSLQDTLEASGTVALVGILTKFTLSKGFLKRLPVIPNVGKIIKPRRYTITWGRIAPQVSL